LLTTNPRWPIKGSEDADFRPSLFKKKITTKLLLEIFSQALMTSSKIPSPSSVVTSHQK